MRCGVGRCCIRGASPRRGLGLRADYRRSRWSGIHREVVFENEELGYAGEPVARRDSRDEAQQLANALNKALAQ